MNHSEKAFENVFVAFVSLSRLIWHPNIIKLLKKPKRQEKFAHLWKYRMNHSEKAFKNVLVAFVLLSRWIWHPNIVKLLKKPKRHEIFTHSWIYRMNHLEKAFENVFVAFVSLSRWIWHPNIMKFNKNLRDMKNLLIHENIEWTIRKRRSRMCSLRSSCWAVEFDIQT